MLSNHMIQDKTFIFIFTTTGGSHKLHDSSHFTLIRVEKVNNKAQKKKKNQFVLENPSFFTHEKHQKEN